MALAIKPVLIPLTTFAEVLHFVTTDANGAEADYIDTMNPPQCYFATSNGSTAGAAHASLNCTMSHLGGGQWLLLIDGSVLTYALINGLFASTTPVLIAIVPNSTRDFAFGAYYPYMEVTGNAIPTLVPGCKFDMAIDFVVPDAAGQLVPYTSGMGTPVCYFSKDRDHNAAVGIACTMTYISGSRWNAAIASSLITSAGLTTLAPSPAPLYMIQSVTNILRFYATAAWKEQREMLAA